MQSFYQKNGAYSVQKDDKLESFAYSKDSSLILPITPDFALKQANSNMQEDLPGISIFNMTSNLSKKTKKKSLEQLNFLYEKWLQKPNPTSLMIKKFADEVNLTSIQVYKWFWDQNQRQQKSNLKPEEMDPIKRSIEGKRSKTSVYVCEGIFYIDGIKNIEHYSTKIKYNFLMIL